MGPFQFVEGETERFVKAIQEAVEAPLARFERELATIRTGRANTKLVEDVKVECYEQVMRIKEIASCSTPDPRMILIQPWDKSIINNIEKGLQQSDVGLVPQNDGDVIRLNLPQMSAERRTELVKLLGKKTEECRVGVRSVRKDFVNMLKDAEKKSKSISEDFAKRLADLLQKEIDSTIARVDKISETKSTDITSL